MTEKKLKAEYDGQTLEFEARRLTFREQEKITNTYLVVKDVNPNTGKSIIDTMKPHEATAYQLAVCVIKPWFDCPEWNGLTDSKRMEKIFEREAGEVTTVFGVWQDFNELPTQKKSGCGGLEEEKSRREA